MSGDSPNGNGTAGARQRVLVAGGLSAIGSLVAELVALHPDLELGAVTARDTGDETNPVGKKLYEVYPEHRIDIEVQDLDLLDIETFDAAVIALPAGPASVLARRFFDAGVTVVDSCGAFRFDDVETYENWYDEPHKEPGLNDHAVYGLPEINRERLEGAKLIGNPGCYPTASVLALAPLARAGLIEDVVIDAKSGVSGAGKRGENAPLFVGTFDNMRPYGVPGHKHQPEIQEQLLRQGYAGSLAFVTHLVPLDQGELVSCYVKPARAVDADEMLALYHDAYRDEPFVELTTTLPGAREVQRTNICRICPVLDRDGGRIFVFATLDNLWKGGASQAIQNLNLALGISEQAGIKGTVALRSPGPEQGDRQLDRSPVSA